MEKLISIIDSIENALDKNSSITVSSALREEEDLLIIKATIVPYLDCIEQEVKAILFVAIKNSKNKKESDCFFDILQKIQGYLARLFFSDHINVSQSLEVFMRDCDRLDDPWLRQHVFNKIKQGTYSL